jgi:hypothetical protein
VSDIGFVKQKLKNLFFEKSIDFCIKFEKCSQSFIFEKNMTTTTFLTADHIREAIVNANKKTVERIEGLMSVADDEESRKQFSLARAMGWTSERAEKARMEHNSSAELQQVARNFVVAATNPPPRELVLDTKRTLVFENRFESARSIEFETSATLTTIQDIPCLELWTFCADMGMSLERGLTLIRGEDPEWVEKLVILSDQYCSVPRLYAAPRALIRIFYALGVPKHPRDAWDLKQ